MERGATRIRQSWCHTLQHTLQHTQQHTLVRLEWGRVGLSFIRHCVHGVGSLFVVSFDLHRSLLWVSLDLLECNSKEAELVWRLKDVACFAVPSSESLPDSSTSSSSSRMALPVDTGEGFFGVCMYACVRAFRGISAPNVGCTCASQRYQCRELPLQCVAVCCDVLRCVVVCCDVLQCAAECCGVLHSAAACCSVPQCAAECCCVLQCAAMCCGVLQIAAECCSVLQRAAVLQCSAMCCSVLQCATLCCSVLQRAVCCSVLQCVAVCCSVLQCVAVCCSVL